MNLDAVCHIRIVTSILNHKAASRRLIKHLPCELERHLITARQGQIDRRNRSLVALRDFDLQLGIPAPLGEAGRQLRHDAQRMTLREIFVALAKTYRLSTQPELQSA